MWCPSQSQHESVESRSSRRLLVAIVRRAILDFAVYKDAHPKREPEQYALGEEAAGWLFSNRVQSEPGEGGYTFLYICQLLDLNPAYLRKRARTLTQEEIQRVNNSDGGL